jgi:hypothetical protein
MGLFIAPQRLQPGQSGWYWMRNDFGGIILAATREELFRRVTDFRRANGLELGDPQGEWTRWVCEEWPDMCQKVPDLPGGPNYSPHASAQTSAQTTGNLGNRVADWLGRVYASQYIDAFVPETQARDRAKICRVCIRNDELKPCCGRNIGDTNQMSLLLRKGRGEGNDLGGCLSLGIDNRLAVHLPEELLPRDLQDAPATCWMRTEGQPQ